MGTVVMITDDNNKNKWLNNSKSMMNLQEEIRLINNTNNINNNRCKTIRIIIRSIEMIKRRRAEIDTTEE